LEIAANQKTLDVTKLSWRQASVQVSTPVSRDWKLEQNTSGTLQGLKVVEIGAKQYGKEGALFALKTLKKTGAQKSFSS